MTRHRDLLIFGGVVVWVAAVLGLDTQASLLAQHGLGAITWLVLLAVLRSETTETRVQVAVVVVFATIVELIFAGWLGVYEYRLENVPMFVPPGHGLVYLAALSLGRSAWAHRHARALVALTTLFLGCWAVWGITLSSRTDALGFFWFCTLLAFLRFGQSPLLYASAVLIVSYLEILGTTLDTWNWGPEGPLGIVAIGNPPSGIAGGYAWFDLTALTLTPVLMRWWSDRRGRADATTERVEEGSLPPR